jgi:hypothetical protein
MSAFDRSVACAGSWRGTSTLQDPQTSSPDESPSSLVVTPDGGRRLGVVMYNVTPDEREEPAVDATYVRA